MIEQSKIAPPRQRVSKIEQVWGENNATGMKLRRHERLWRAAYKELDQEKGLSPAAIELLDVLNAFARMTRQSEKSRAQAYATMGVQIRMLDDVSVQLWDKAIRAEYNHLQDPDLDEHEFKSRFKKSWHFHFFLNESDAFHDTFYLNFNRNVRLLSNVIRTTGAKDRDGKPLIFEQRQRELLYPHYNVYEKMSDADRLESVGVMRLHHAWKTTDDGEKQKIKRFVTAHANEMDSVIALVESRYVDSLDHLETLMASSASPALMEGVL